MPRKKRNPIKVAAGRKGARVRWRRTLAWHRRLEQLRGGFSGDGWRACLRHLALRYTLLRHAGGGRLGPQAREDLERLERELRPVIGASLTIRQIGGLAWARDARMDGPPMIAIRWSQLGLERLLQVTPEERAALSPPERPRKPSPRTMRLAAVIDVRQQARGKLSLRELQRRLASQGIRVPLTTLRRDLARIRK